MAFASNRGLRGPDALPWDGHCCLGETRALNSETTGRISHFMARPKSTGETRQRLLEEGVAAFLTHGYHGTGIKQVLDQIGVPKGSFYNYFDSKEAFGAATIEHYADCLAGNLARTMSDAPDALAGLRAFFEAQMKAFEQANYVGGCLVANLGGELEGSQVFRQALSAALGRYLAGVSAAVRTAQQEGTVRRDLSSDELARILVDAWEGAVIRMKIEQSLLPLRQCLERMLDGFFKP